MTRNAEKTNPAHARRQLRVIPIVEVMTGENLVTAPVGTSLKDAESILQAHKIEKLLNINKK